MIFLNISFFKDIKDSLKDYKKGDIGDIDNEYTANGVILPPNAPAVSGRSGKFFQ